MNLDPSLRALVLALAVVAPAAALAAGEPIKLGVSGPFTGGTSPLGVSMRDGIRMAIAEINAAGGVLGRPLEAVERDDESKNERGVQLAQELIFKEKIVAGVGVMNTGVMLASQRFYQEAKVPIVTPGPTGTAVTQQFADQAEHYVFRVSLPDVVQADMIVNEAVGKRGMKRVAIISDSTNYGQLGKDDIVAALDARGVKPVAIEKFNLKDVDMTPQLLRAKAAGAQAVLTYGVGPELAQIANGMSKLDWKVPMMGSWTLSMPNFVEIAGANAEGARFPQTFVLDPSHPRKKAFADKYKSMFGVSRIPAPVWAAQAYDTVYIVAAAIRQAGSTEGPKIRAALESLDTPVDGLVMRYDKPFSRTSHDAINIGNSRVAAVMAEIRGGEVVPLNDK